MRPTMLTRTDRLSIAAAGVALALATAGCAGQHPNLTAATPTDAIQPAATTSPAGGPAPVALPAPPPATGTATATGSGTGTGTGTGTGAGAATSARPAPRRPVSPHFDTPQQAMRYLAAAYNRGDSAALKKVTNANARAALLQMRGDAINLQLLSCSRRASGDYICQFRHDFLPSLHRRGHGHATFLAAPAAKPGWYMTVLIDCD